MLKNLGRLFLLTVILSVSACAVMQPKTDEERVIALAEQRQAALLERDFLKAYQFMSPGYRSVKNLDRFKLENAGAVNLLDFNVQSAECTEDTCTVSVVSDYKVALVGRGFSSKNPLVVDYFSKEIWIRSNGKWWFVKNE